MHDADDLRSYEAAVLARKAPMQLSLNSGLKGRRERSGTNAGANSNMSLTLPNPHNERMGSYATSDRPSFKRLPSQVLEPGGSKKQRGGSDESSWGGSDWSGKVED